MFIIFHGTSPISICHERATVKQILAGRYEAFRRQMSGNSYYARQFGSTDGAASAQMSGLKVVSIPDNTAIDLDYQNARSLISDNCPNNVTSLFFTLEETQVKVGEHITAKVVKKKLKSFGETVVINDTVKRASNTVAPTPQEFKELYDKLARINCTVGNYGNITVAPDSLDEYKMTPKYKVVKALKWVD